MNALFLIWTGLTGIWLLSVAIRSWKFSRQIVSLEDVPSEQTEPWPKVSLIVPACNEADTIEDAARSLLTMKYPNLEIILVNDRSTDGTRDIVDRLARLDHRIKAVHIRELPSGWLGKVNALSEGMKRASGEWLLIADADVHFSPAAIKKAIVYSRRENLDFLTTVPGVRADGWPLRAIMAQFFHQGSLLVQPKELNNPKNSVCIGIGAFMLLRRSVYEQSEQLQWIRMEAVDDSGMALMMRRAGAKMGLVAGLNEIELVWYPTVLALVHGIEKNAFAICQYSLPVLIGSMLILLGTFFGYTLAPFLSGSWIAAAYMAVCMAIFLVCVGEKIKKTMHADLPMILLIPLSMFVLPFFYVRASFLIYWRGGINWRGTFYTLKELRENQRVRFLDLLFTRQKFSIVKPARPAVAWSAEKVAVGQWDLGTESFRQRLRRRPPGSELRPHDLRVPERSL